MEGAWPSNVISKFCRAKNGLKRKWNRVTATKSYSSSAGGSFSTGIRWDYFSWSSLPDIFSTAPGRYVLRKSYAKRRYGSSNAVEDVAHLLFLGLQIRAGSFRDAGLAGNSLDYANARFFKLTNFFRVIGQQADFPGAELFQDLRGEVVVARVGGEA